MKKLTVAFDGYKFSESAKENTVFIARQQNVHVVGVFLDDELYNSYRLSDIYFNGEDHLKELNRADKEKRDKSVNLFETAMHTVKLNYTIRRPKEVTFNALLHETIYTDLLVIDKNETFTHFEETAPTRFISELVAETQCPVLLVPNTFKPVSKIILLYNGKPSSVSAIKMFSYLLPAFKHLPTELLTVNDEKKTLHLPDNKLLKELMHRHFPDATFKVLKGDAEEEILRYLKTQEENVLVVLGASQRNMVSRLLKRTLADSLMEKTKLPMFIVQKG